MWAAINNAVLNLSPPPFLSITEQFVRHVSMFTCLHYIFLSSPLIFPSLLCYNHTSYAFPFSSILSPPLPLSLLLMLHLISCPYIVSDFLSRYSLPLLCAGPRNIGGATGQVPGCLLWQGTVGGHGGELQPAYRTMLQLWGPVHL